MPDSQSEGFAPNVKDEPRPRLARAVLLGARIVTAVVVGSGALFGALDFAKEVNGVSSMEDIDGVARDVRSKELI
jgi:hypothetical protein